MRILMINSVCGIRSTGRICSDLAKELEKAGHVVKIAYGRETVPDDCSRFAVKIENDVSVKAHALKARLFDSDGLGSAYATRKLVKWMNEYDPDVIHLHNLHGYYIHYPILFDYIVKKKKRVIWTLHDCWAFTGHGATCDHINCEKWKSGCFNCPATHGYPSSLLDFSKRNFRIKQEIYSRLTDVTIVTPSNWLKGLVEQSILQRFPIRVINNGIDIQQFHPLYNDFREAYGLAGKILLMGCKSAWTPRAGLDDFFKLAEMLDDRFRIVLVGLSDKQMKTLPTNVVGIHKTESVKELASIYSTSDLFLNLTYSDNFPTVNLEALACGTPVLTYETGGSPECITSQNGVIIPKGDLEKVVDFLNAYFVENSSIPRFQIINNDRNAFSSDLFAKEYVDLVAGGGIGVKRNTITSLERQSV